MLPFFAFEAQEVCHGGSRIALLELLRFSAKAGAFIPFPFLIHLSFCSPSSHADKSTVLHFFKFSVFRYYIVYQTVGFFTD